MTQIEPLTLTVDELAKRLRISRGSAYQAVRDGTIPHLRIGNRILIPQAALARLLAEAGRDAS
jgi:excisionase family DNA binding protein